jgi:hypothetical protein
MSYALSYTEIINSLFKFHTFIQRIECMTTMMFNEEMVKKMSSFFLLIN